MAAPGCGPRRSRRSGPRRGDLRDFRAVGTDSASALSRRRRRGGQQRRAHGRPAVTGPVMSASQGGLLVGGHGYKVMSAPIRRLLLCTSGRARLLQDQMCCIGSSGANDLMLTTCRMPRLTDSPEAKEDLVSTAKNVVLVHGGWVDGSGWHRVYGILTGDGYDG